LSLSIDRNSILKISAVFINFGLYHVARLNAAHEACKQRGWDFLAIQITNDVLEHDWGDASAKLTSPWINVIPSNGSRQDMSKIVFSEIAGQKLFDTLETVRPNAILIPGWSFSVARAALRWCERNNAMAILMSESNEFDEKRVWWKEWCKRRIVKQFDSAMVGGSSHKSYLVKLGFPKDRITTGYDVIDNEYFAKERISHHPPPISNSYFLSVNRFIEKKNLLTLIDAYAAYKLQSKSKPWDLVLCGDGHLRDSIKERIARHGLLDSIHLTGFLKPEQLQPYFAHAGCFVHSSAQEQWGLVVNEAMSASLPIVVSNRCGCYEELVEEGRNGFGFCPTNTSHLATILLKVSSNPRASAEMGANSQQRIAKYGPSRFGNALVDCVQLGKSEKRKLWV
jgi:1,2-diacylglycerol 3-alpha-glucosyltransferase